MMTTIFRYSCALLLLSLIPLKGFAESVLFEATYEGEYAGFNIVTLRRLVELDDGSYRLESTASNFLGSLTETSHFETDGAIWRPLTYTYKRRVFGIEAVESIDFDWQTLTARYTHSKEPEMETEHLLAPGVLDPALYLLRLQRDLLLGMDELDYAFLKRDRIRHYTIERHRKEPLSYDDKEYSAVKLQRANTEDSKNTYVWALPKLDYLFGKIEHVEDGDAHQMKLIEYDVDNDKLEAFFTAPAAAAAAQDDA